MKRKDKTIGIIGLWHLGCVYAASLAAKGFEVVGFDFDKGVISSLKRNIPPLFEPKLEKTLKKFNNITLHFTTSEKEFFQKNDYNLSAERVSSFAYIFITYDVPVDENDLIQIGIINKVFAILSKYVSAQTAIVISSQIPIGTSRRLVNLLKKKTKETPKVIYFPENLRLGQAFASFLTPERIVLGSDSIEALNNFKKDFSFFNCPFITMSLESAEMVKHALNSYLATCISFSSELSDLSEKSGANMLDVVKALKTDKRVSSFAPINPGLGFAGGTLGRDIQSLRKMSKALNYQPKLLNAVYSVNQDRLPMLISKIHSIYTPLKGKSIGILGLTYRPNTDTLRRSMSLELINKLKSSGCKIKAFDPAIKMQVKDYTFVEISKSIRTFFKDLDLVVLMTDWPEFTSIDPKTVASLMNNKILIDTKNFLDKQTYEENGFIILRIGEGK